MHGQRQRLARPVRQREREELAVVAAAARGAAPCGRSRCTRGCASAAWRTARRASPRRPAVRRRPDRAGTDRRTGCPGWPRSSRCWPGCGRGSGRPRTRCRSARSGRRSTTAPSARRSRRPRRPRRPSSRARRPPGPAPGCRRRCPSPSSPRFRPSRMSLLARRSAAAPRSRVLRRAARPRRAAVHAGSRGTVDAMQQRPLGSTGLWVSRLALGTMTWGRDTDEHEARDQWKTFLDVGRHVHRHRGRLRRRGQRGAHRHAPGARPSSRDKVVLATKAVSRPRTERRFDASRGHLLASLDGSLRRLDTDYVDLWYLHAWDPAHPAGGDPGRRRRRGAIRQGPLRRRCPTTRAGSWRRRRPGSARCPAARRSPLRRWSTRWCSAASSGRSCPAAQALGVGITPWSPLGRGVLTGKYRYGTPSDSRAASPHFGSFVAEYLDDRSRRIVDAVVHRGRRAGRRPARGRAGLGAGPTRRHRARSSAPAPSASCAACWSPRTWSCPEEIRTALDDISAPSLGYPEHGWNQLTR